MKQLGTVLSCTFTNSEDFIGCLRTKSVKSLILTSDIFGQLARFAQMTWTPTNEPESDDAFLTDTPRNLINQNQMKDLPFMTGQTADEGLALTAR